jgi:hypothetical protein
MERDMDMSDMNCTHGMPGVQPLPAALATLALGAAFAMMFFGFFFTRQVWRCPLPLAGLTVKPGPRPVVPAAALSAWCGLR